MHYLYSVSLTLLKLSETSWHSCSKNSKWRPARKRVMFLLIWVTKRYLPCRWLASRSVIKPYWQASSKNKQQDAYLRLASLSTALSISISLISAFCIQRACSKSADTWRQALNTLYYPCIFSDLGTKEGDICTYKSDADLEICFCQNSLDEISALQLAVTKVTAAAIGCGKVWSPQVLHECQNETRFKIRDNAKSLLFCLDFEKWMACSCTLLGH